MININLKPGTKLQAPKGDRVAAFREQLRGLRDKIKAPGLVVACGTWLVVVVALVVLFLHTNSRISALEPKMQTAEDEYKRYRNFVNEKKREGRSRDSILAQIGTITAVDQDRFTWAHILDEIAGAMPDFTWLTSVSPLTVAGAPVVDTDSTAAPPVSVLIAGQTNDLQNYTAFLRRLGESHWLINVIPVKTATIIDKNNRAITEFTVQATFSPTLDFRATGLRYAVSLDEQPPQIVNLAADTTLRAWEGWVSDNAIVARTRHRVAGPGEHVLRFWLVGPGVVLQKLVVARGDVPPSYLGPPESFHRP